MIAEGIRISSEDAEENKEKLEKATAGFKMIRVSQMDREVSREKDQWKDQEAVEVLPPPEPHPWSLYWRSNEG